MLNCVAYAPCLRRSFLADPRICVFGFDVLPEAYADDPFFSKLMPSVKDGSTTEYVFMMGFLSR